MTNYFVEQEYIDAKAQRKRTLTAYLVIAALYLVSSITMVIYFTTLPYESPNIGTVKFIHYAVSVVFVIFSVIYLGIVFRRVNRYYKLTLNLNTGLRETSIGSFFEYDERIQDKDGVDCKALVFIEWNKYKKDFYERKVLVFHEKPFPEFKEKQTVKYVTQGNVLISYEIQE